MVETSPLAAEAGERSEIWMYVTGIAAGLIAAYYTGQTGDWRPLLAVAMTLTLVVLFVDSE
jgi:hypothetical protein